MLIDAPVSALITFELGITKVIAFVQEQVVPIVGYAVAEEATNGVFAAVTDKALGVTDGEGDGAAPKAAARFVASGSGEAVGPNVQGMAVGMLPDVPVN